MTERPWESDDDRDQVQKRQESDRSVVGCFLFAIIAFSVLVVLVVLFGL